MGGKGSGRPKNPPKPKKLLKEIIPITDIFSEEEITLYNNLVDVYMQDFEGDELTSSDLDDIMDLAKNRVLELRLLKTTKDSADAQVDISAAIEKIRKQNEKFKENLSARRKDRINPNEFKGFSIVDLAVAYDEERKEKLAKRINKNKLEQEDVLLKRKDYLGNRYDKESDQEEALIEK